MSKRNTQFKNPNTGHWCKRDRATGRIIDVKSSEGPYMNIQKEKK
ncbi:hypothetical protein OAQ99_04525 [Candidatus Kapabacteria bacterium]|nr:hypothetical protein [Candidatus Kapabacteria bacterium]